MIVARYGAKFQSVRPDFDPRAMNEIGFRRDQTRAIPEDELSGWSVLAEHEFGPEASGDVHGEVEAAVLEELSGALATLESGLEEGVVLVVENRKGVDWPKTRQEQRTVFQGGDNRLSFRVRVDPPLRVTVRRPEA